MVSDLRNGAENVPAGATPTNANSGGGTATAITDTNIGGASTLTADSTHHAHGTQSYKAVCVSGQPTYWRWTFTGAAQREDHVYVYLTAYPATGTSLPVGQLRSAGGAVCTPVINDAGQVLLQDATSAGHAHITTALLPLNQWNRIEYGAKPGTTTANGTLQLAVYDNTETAIETPWVGSPATGAGQNAGTAVIVESRKGKAVSGTYAGTWWFDDAECSDAGTGPIGPFVPVAPTAPTAPTATGGSFGATVGWTAPSYDGDSPILHYHVTAYISGAAVATQDTADGTTLSMFFSGLTAGTSYTFTIDAVNAAGSSPESSATSAVAVSGSPQTRALATDDLATGWTSTTGASPIGPTTHINNGIDGIVSPVSPSSAKYVGKYVPPDAPADANGWAIHSKGLFLGGATSGTIKTELVQGPLGGTPATGGTVIAATGNVPLTGLEAEYDLAVTSTQAANITDRTDLHVRYTVTAA